MSTVLVTGGTGLVGSHVAVHFANEGYQVIAVDARPRTLDYMADAVKERRIRLLQADILDMSRLEQVVSESQVEGIVHTAAQAVEQRCREEPYHSFSINVIGTLNILEIARRNDLRVVDVSTTGTYGPRESLDDLHEDDRLWPERLVYGCSKAAAEMVVLGYRSGLQTRATAVRLCGVYGPGLEAIQNVIHQWLTLTLEGKAVILDSGAERTNDWTYVKDAAYGIFLAYVKGTSGVYNITSGRLAKMSEVADAIRVAVPSARLEIGPGVGPRELVQGPIRGGASIGRARKEIGYEPQFSLAAGVNDFAAWLQDRLTTQ